MNPITRTLLVLLTGLPLGACCSFTEGSSKVRTQQLETAHLAFIDNHTRSAERKPWVAADFDREVQGITSQFDSAQGSESFWCPARLQFVKNSKELFDKDAALVKKAGEGVNFSDALSPTFAKEKKELIRKNYALIAQ